MTEEKKRKLIIIAGPTATGKSAAAVELAKRIGGEVISADSMQVYRGMDIGSAKVTKEEMQGVPHHLIDVLEPEEAFNITLFQKMATDAAEEIYSRGHVPIICGGTGFYIQSVLYGIEFTREETDLAYRAGLEELPADKLYEMLKAVDPASCEAIHANNRKRVIRALEFYHETGQPISAHNAQERAREAAFDARFFVLTDERSVLYERIDARVDRMVEAGLVDEVKRLKERGIARTAVSMQGLGYKEIYDYLSGEYSLEEAVKRIKQGSRHYAKRQLTWFKRERDTIWLDRSTFKDAEREIVDRMEEEYLNDKRSI
ncbi:MAG: tRNA (adenosine(37)-N6)-dimethylallyltransferase MiaA [Lachnospiraceae bacterium]|nr:tRNA (adenosine(37)-N6)-dimethylallyltransferase MiaA [Lachnospiraceae bacterium]